MESQDDPEDRIRELERPLADTAHASELGTEIRNAPPSGYTYPPPPPGPVPPPLAPAPYSYGYGAPPPGMAPQSSSGNRVWWILAAVFVVGVLALVGIIAASVSHRFSRGNLVVPSATPGTSRIISPPRAIPRSPAPSSVTPLPAQGAELTVTGINENQALTCNNNTVTVSGVSNTVIITGHCVSLSVSGLNNIITVEATDTIDASGLNNQVTYHLGTPQISKSGDGNVVQQG
jgi:hypothetical protein